MTQLIAQIWRGTVRASDREPCTAQLLARIHTALAHPTSCKGAYLLARSTGAADVELMVLTLFGGIVAASCHDDATAYRAVVFAEPLPFVVEQGALIYEVLSEPRRTLLYANLRRRFPLRLMAPR